MTEAVAEPIQFDDTPVKWMIYPAIIFFVLGMTVGVFIAFNGFVFPDYFAGEYIHFGRMRPVHVGSVALLWLLSANAGLFYYFVPRLCGVPLWSNRLAYVTIAIWWFSLIMGVYSYPWGTNNGWEYAELPAYILNWIPIKFLFTTAWVLFSINIYATIFTRRYEKMYVSLWYVMGNLFWTAFTVIAGIFAINWVPGGISKVNINWFYVHNLVGLIFTPMGLATAYYALPKLAHVPIYSHRLSMIGFWSLAFVYSWVGAHHMIHGPISQWLQTTSIIFSIWLFIPVWSVVLNIYATLSETWDKYLESAAIRFLMMGNIFYLITCVQGPLMALRNINEITSKTDWVIGHSHISLYATFTFFAIAGIYQALPALTKKPLWSKNLANWHFSLNLLGSFPFIIALFYGGFLQGMMWATWSEGSTYAEFHQKLAMFPFLQTIAETRIWWIWRGIGGIIILFANILFVINVFNTVVLKPREKERVNELQTKAISA